MCQLPDLSMLHALAAHHVSSDESPRARPRHLSVELRPYRAGHLRIRRVERLLRLSMPVLESRHLRVLGTQHTPATPNLRALQPLQLLVQTLIHPGPERGVCPHRPGTADHLAGPHRVRRGTANHFGARVGHAHADDGGFRRPAAARAPSGELRRPVVRGVGPHGPWPWRRPGGHPPDAADVRPAARPV